MIVRVKVDAKFTEPYFCPFCRTLFTREKDYKTTKKPFKTHVCKNNHCKKFFGEHDFKEEARNGKNYKFPKDYDSKGKTETKFIEEIIKKLWREGYSNRAIHIITKFSRSKIQMFLEEKKRKGAQLLYKEFCIKYLSIIENDYEKIMSRFDDKKLAYLTDELIDAIRKATLFGCTKRQVSSLFKVSYNTIEKALTQEYGIIKEARLDKLNEEDTEVEIRRLNNLLKNKEDKVIKQARKKNKIKIVDDLNIEIIRLEL